MDMRPGFLRGAYRLALPFFTLRALPCVPGRYWSFWRDMVRYRRLAGEGAPTLRDVFPCIHDRGSNPFDPHYFYQDVWAFREVVRRAPRRHVDVGSTAIFVGMVSAVAEVTFVDIRPLDVSIERYEYRPGSILSLPFESASVESLSCLHVAEHIGLGRYGDPLDPEGTRKAAAELTRVLAPGGQLLFSVPIGRPRTEFNAHRIHSSTQVLGFFPGLRLKAYAGVDDRGQFSRSRQVSELDGCDYGCGFFALEKPAETA